MRLAIVFSFVILATGSSLVAQAQNATLKGKVIDRKTKQPLEGATATLTLLKDSTQRVNIPTRRDGLFEFKNLKKETYNLHISYVGYSSVLKKLTIENDIVDFGVVEMFPIVIRYSDVVVQGNAAPVAQIGDTTVFNAAAFKTNPDATAEELIIKLPTISVENGTVKAQGEDVKQVLVDGKQFFGSDPMLALRNLPAEAIDKIQVFDKLSDQAEFTGFDDGQSIKTLNIITRQNRRNGEFGKLYAGYGESERYTSGGNFNSFQSDRRISALGLSNNINQQNFSTEDILGAVGGGGRRPGFGGGFDGGGAGRRGGMTGGRGGGSGGPGMGRQGGGFGGNDPSNFLVGQQDGITTANSLGLNYSDKWGEGLEVTGSYFFNATHTENNQTIAREYILSADSSTYYNETNNADVNNTNHRLNMRIEYALDEVNSFIFRPQISFQNNRSTSSLFGNNVLASGTPLNRSASSGDAHSNGYNGSGNITFRHKFEIPGRTFSVDLGIRANDKGTDNNLSSLSSSYRSITVQTDTIDQLADGTSNGRSISSRISYTEPIGPLLLLQFNYNPSYSKSISDTKMYRFDQATEAHTRLDSLLSNTFENEYLTQGAEIGVRLRLEGLNITAGVSYQVADLKNVRTFPFATNISKIYRSVLPNAMLMYSASRTTSLRINYRASTNAPSISQLQDVVDNSNPLSLSSGNPDLKQATNHSLQARYTTNSPQSNSSFFIFLNLSYMQDYIGKSTFYASSDTTIAGGIQLNSGAQFTKPVNLDHALSSQLFLMYNTPVDFLQSNVNLSSGITYASTPSVVNNEESFSTAPALSEGIQLASNISEDIDFTVSYSLNYSLTRYSLQGNLDNTYTTQVGRLRANWIIGWGFVVRSDAAATLYKDSQGTPDRSFILWNASIGKKFLANDSGELRVSVADVLNQNTSVRYSASDISIENTTNKVLGRYALLIFTYTIR
jgi:hypothetical protein